VYKRNVAVALAAIAYSVYALYASGMEAVFGGMMVMMLGYLLYGFVAKKFIGDGAPAANPAKD
jgi:putrescine:ornithine antiporter